MPYTILNRFHLFTLCRYAVLIMEERISELVEEREGGSTEDESRELTSTWNEYQLYCHRWECTSTHPK